MMHKNSIIVVTLMLNNLLHHVLFYFLTASFMKEFSKIIIWMPKHGLTSGNLETSE